MFIANPVDTEYDRLKALSLLDLDYDELQAEFANLTELAARIADTEISLVNFIDTYTQWSVSTHGINNIQMPREDSVCQFTILEEEHLEIKRLEEDERFSSKPYVAGKGGLDLSYYFGIPLTLHSGENLGALCVLDKVEKKLSPEKIEQLHLIAQQIVDSLEIKKELKEARQQIVQIRQTLKILAHDVRGPINGILGVSEMALFETLNGLESRSYFRIIANSSKELKDLTDDILKDHISNGKEDEGEIQIKDLAQKILNLYLPQAQPKNIELLVEYDPMQSNASVNKNKLLQIIGNLISNAIKFAPNKGRVWLKLGIQDSKYPKSFKIEVENTGTGISIEKIRDILDGKSLTTIGSAGEIGYGLGLKMVKQIVDEIEGNLSVSEGENRGAKFFVVIPQF